MLRKYRNKLFEVIKTEGWETSLFSGSDEKIGDRSVFVIRLNHSPLQFIVGTSDEDLLSMDCRFTLFATNYPLSDWIPEAGYAQYELIEDRFRHWLKIVDEYIEDMNTPDLWTTLSDEFSKFDQKAIQDNISFTQSEKDRISESLYTMLNEARAKQILNESQMKLLEEKIDYLIEASDRLGRKDWINAATGAIFGYLFQAALTSDNAKTLLHMASEAIKWITHNPLFLGL
jgi:hypothetical protein